MAHPTEAIIQEGKMINLALKDNHAIAHCITCSKILYVQEKDNIATRRVLNAAVETHSAQLSHSTQIVRHRITI